MVGEEIAHCPPTVPSGDTLCVTAGDAQRMNPWRVESGEGEKKEISQPALTVPGGDTPCLTAGDARRANPWRVERERKEKPPSPHPLSPAGDTPCVTAGDAQRANPWRSGEESLRHQRCRTAFTPAHASLYSLNAFSATLPASESSLYTPPRVHPRHSSGITRG